LIVQDWVLRVDLLHERPVLGHYLDVVGVHPEVAGLNKVYEEALAELLIGDKESQLCQQLDCLAVDGLSVEQVP